MSRRGRVASHRHVRRCNSDLILDSANERERQLLLLNPQPLEQTIEGLLNHLLEFGVRGDDLPRVLRVEAQDLAVDSRVHDRGPFRVVGRSRCRPREQQRLPFGAVVVLLLRGGGGGGWRDNWHDRWRGL